jgi:5-oxoprolinase (ATP-hydrolysing)
VEEKVVEQKVDLKDFDHVDPVQLSVYGHRLMGIAEQVSTMLRLQVMLRGWG